MSDLISRADAMAEFREWVKRANENGETPTWNDAVSLIGSLPSADALLKQEIDFHKEVSRIEAEKVVDLEHKLADMVSVVRCKDCIYRNKTKVNDKGFEVCDATGMDITDNDFCSYGERAEQTEYKLPGHDEVMEALDNMKLEFTIHGTERVKRMAGDGHE